MNRRTKEQTCRETKGRKGFEKNKQTKSKSKSKSNTRRTKTMEKRAKRVEKNEEEEFKKAATISSSEAVLPPLPLLPPTKNLKTKN